MPAFPNGFTWGVATSAYQIEGAVAEEGRGPSIWDTFCKLPGTIRDGHTGDVATDHYHRWREDVASMAELGLTAYRFSIAWPRVQPAGSGEANRPGLDFYDRLVDALLAAGITPMPTLYHWDLPEPLEDAGGWMNRQTAQRFADYATLVAQRLADRVDTWITLNEPFVVMTYGYMLGIHAPGKSLMLDALPTAHYQLLGHGLATQALRACGARQVMLTNNYSPAWPASSKTEDIAATAAYDVLQNRIFTDPVLLGTYPDLSAFGRPDGLSCIAAGDLDIITTPIDGIGVNYYNPTRLSALPESPLPFQMQPIPGYPTTAFGWPIVPAGLTELIGLLAERYGDKLPPLYITENGCSQADEPVGDSVADPGRIDYLDGHLRAVHRAIESGIDVRGYFHWTLNDNFEWTEGYHQRFGLIYTDFASQRRIPKTSFAWYRDLIASHRDQ